jgi:hypothetical protein
MGIIEGLPEDVQQSIDQPVAAAAQPSTVPSAGALAPSPTTQDTTPPDLGGGASAPGSLAEKISAAFLQHLASRQPSPVAGTAAQSAQQPARGTTGQRISGAIDNVAAGLGDAAHAHDTSGGWLSGVANTLNARTQRLAGEKQQQFQNDEQKKKDDQLIAMNQVRTVALQRNIYKQDQDLREASFKQGSAFAESLRDKHDIQDNISQSQLSEIIKKNPNYLQSHYAKQTNEENVYDADGKPTVDKQGNPVMSPIYSLITRDTKDGSPNVHLISQDDHDFILKNTGQNIPVNTNYPFDSWMSTNTSAHANHNTLAMINKSRSEDLTSEQQRQVQTELADTGVQHAIASVPGKPLGGLYQFLQNGDAHLEANKTQMQAAQQKGDQAAVQKLQQDSQQLQDERAKVSHVIDFGFSTADKNKYAEDEEKERHNKADEANKAAEIAAKKAAGEGPVASPGDRALVQQIIDGRSDLPTARTKEGQRIGELVAQADSSYDMSKGTTWTKTRNEYMGSGATAKKVVSYNTALEHMADLYSNSTAAGLYEPGSKEYSDRAVAVNYVSNEVGSAIKNGVMTEKEGNEILDSLKGWTPWTAKERTAETARLLHDKIDEYQRKFDEAKPSQSVKVPILMSPKAGAAYDYVQSGGKTQLPQRTQQPQLPPAAAQQLKEGQTTTFANGQTWTLKNGQPAQISGAK